MTPNPDGVGGGDDGVGGESGWCGVRLKSLRLRWWSNRADPLVEAHGCALIEQSD